MITTYIVAVSKKRPATKIPAPSPDSRKTMKEGRKTKHRNIFQTSMLTYDDFYTSTTHHRSPTAHRALRPTTPPGLSIILAAAPPALPAAAFVGGSLSIYGATSSFTDNCLPLNYRATSGAVGVPRGGYALGFAFAGAVSGGGSGAWKIPLVA